jgi:heme A synthase
MNKQKALRWLNLALFLLLILQMASGVAALFGLGPSSLALHIYAGLAMFIVVLAHLWLNWGWVKMNYFRKKE